MIARILRGVRKHGPVGTVRAARDVLIVAPARRAFRRRARPSLREMIQVTGSIETRAADLVRQLGFTVPEELVAAAEAHAAELERRTRSTVLVFPERFAVERESGVLLYLITRVLRPRVVVETGVANGASTFFFLRALEENGDGGRLTSVDVAKDVGSLLTPEERSAAAWDLQILGGRTFEDVIAGVGSIDLFFHDSDHSYANQSLELRVAWPRMSNGGLIGSDDVEMNFAYLDVAAEFGAHPLGLFDRRKMVMFSRV